MINPIDPGWLRISDALSGQEERPRRGSGKAGRRKKNERPILDQKKEEEKEERVEGKDLEADQQLPTIDIVA